MSEKPTYEELEQRVLELEGPELNRNIIEIVAFPDLENHSEIILLIDPDSGVIINANIAAQNYYGYSIKTLEQMKIQEINMLSPDEVTQRLKQSAVGKLNYFEFPHRLSSGEIRTVEVHSWPVVLNDKKLLFLTIHDITERKQAEKALRENESKLQLVVDGISDLIIYIDSKLRYLFVNTAYAEWYGCSPKDLYGKSLKDILPEDVFNRALPYYQTALNGEDVYFENRTIDIAGKDKVVSVRMTPHFRKERVIGLIALVKNITERKQAEDELNTIFNLSPDLICEANLDGYFKKLNPAWEDALGFTIEELCSKPYINFIHPNDQKLTMKEVEKLFSGKSTIKFENRYLCKNGSYKSLEWNSPPFNSNGLVYAVARDITKRKQMLEALNNSEKKLKKLNEELEDKIKQRTASLENLNTALSVLLKKRDDDKNQIGKNIYHNFKSLIQPLMNQLRNSLTINVQEDILNILESSIKEITTPFSKKMSDPIMGLTPTEIQVASLVKNGKTNKEIVQLLNKSIRTVSAHRENIRLKFGLKNKKVNLKTYLLSLD